MNTSLSTLCMAKVEAANFARYLRGQPAGAGAAAFRVSIERLLAALRPKCREAPASVSMQLGEPYIVVCASYDDADLQVVTKIMAEGCQFMFASHPVLEAYPIQLDLPASILSAYLRSLCPTTVSATGIQLTFVPPNRCIIAHPEGDTAGQVALDPRDIGRLWVREAASVLLSRQDLGIICGIRSSSAKDASGALLLQIYVSPAHAPVVVKAHLDAGIELQCILSSLEASAPPSVIDQGAVVTAPTEASEPADSYIPASCSDLGDYGEGDGLSIPGTPLEIYH